MKPFFVRLNTSYTNRHSETNHTYSQIKYKIMNRLSRLSCLFLLACLPALLPAQRYFTRNAKAYFDATNKNSPERVEAISNSGTLVVDIASGRVEAAVLIKGFLFEKALMQEHFNENYLESSKFPKATFKGQIDDLSKLDLSKDGTYTVGLRGDMSLHGQTKALQTTATFTVKGKEINAKANFPIVLADYDIKIPSPVADKLAKQAKVEITASLEQMK